MSGAALTAGRLRTWLAALAVASVLAATPAGACTDRDFYNGAFLLWDRGEAWSTTVNEGHMGPNGWWIGPGAPAHAQRRAVRLQDDVPFRYYLSITWAAAYPLGEDGTATGWSTILEHGEVFGAPHCHGGVRRWAGRRITISAWMRVGGGPVPVRPIVWQSFGAEPGMDGPSPPVFLVGTLAYLWPAWQRLTWTFDVPSVAQKAVSPDGNDYLGFGLQMPALYGPRLDIGGVAVDRVE